jgi:ketosteroid isomerase-like protein
MKHIFALLLCAAFAAPPVQAQGTAAQQRTSEEIRAQVRTLMTATNYDVMGTLDLYVRSPRVSSINDETIVQGWRGLVQATEAAAPNQGNFFVRVGEVDVTLMGTDHALAVAPMTMEYQTDNGRVRLPGSMTLAFERTEGGWKILHEHYSTGLDQEALASMAEQAAAEDSGVSGLLGILFQTLIGDYDGAVGGLANMLAGDTCPRD